MSRVGAILFWAGLLLAFATGFCPQSSRTSFVKTGLILPSCQTLSALFMNKRRLPLHSCQTVNQLLDLAADNINGLPPYQYQQNYLQTLLRKVTARVLSDYETVPVSIGTKVIIAMDRIYQTVRKIT
eukprot:scaffold85737_cov56-Cyclotella_meneghiniana.AAC.5